MKKALFALAALGFILTTGHFAQAEDKKAEKMTGVLIDEHCGEEMAKKGDDAQKSAEGHKKACALKCAKDGGLEFMADGKLTKLDEASDKKALEYLKGEKHGTKVVIMASKNDDGSLNISEIKPAKKDEEKKD